MNNIKKLLTERGISYSDLAMLLDVSVDTVYNKLNRKTEFTYSEFQKICTLFYEYRPEYLFDETA